MKRIKSVYLILVVFLFLLFGGLCIGQVIVEWLQPHGQSVDWTGGTYSAITELEQASDLIVTGSPVSSRPANMGGMDGYLVTFGVDRIEKGTQSIKKVLVFLAAQQPTLQKDLNYRLYLEQYYRTGLFSGFSQSYRTVGGDQGIIEM